MKKGGLATAEQAALESATDDALDDRWEASVREALDTGIGLADALEVGDPTARRGRLRQVYANCLVTSRITVPVLAFPFALLAEISTGLRTAIGEDANPPSPRETVLRVRKNARPRSRRERAFHTWWTLSGSNRPPLPCKGSALPNELRALGFSLHDES